MTNTTSIRDKNKRRRVGFTLVELLAVLLVMSILAGMFLYVYRGAQVDAQVARTRMTISKIHVALASGYEEFLTMPMPVDVPDLWLAFDNNGARVGTPEMVAKLKLRVIRDTIRMSWPDRPGDVSDNASSSVITDDPIRHQNIGASILLAPSPARCPVPQSAVAIRKSIVANGDANWWDENANAELLVLVVSQSVVDGAPALDNFRPSEFGDTDGDGLLEFVDAWNRPIQWIRWPYGLEGTTPFGVDVSLSDGADPFDIMRVDPNSTALFPYVFSLGLDGEAGIVRNEFEQDAASPWMNDPQLRLSTRNFSLSGADPVYPMRNPSISVSLQLGATLGGAADDNITNYDDFGASL